MLLFGDFSGLLHITSFNLYFLSFLSLFLKSILRYLYGCIILLFFIKNPNSRAVLYDLYFKIENIFCSLPLSLSLSINWPKNQSEHLSLREHFTCYQLLYVDLKQFMSFEHPGCSFRCMFQCWNCSLGFIENVCLPIIMHNLNDAMTGMNSIPF